MVLLAVGIAGAMLRLRCLPVWAVPVAAALADLAAGAISAGGARAALDPLADPIGFLLAAVPLAVLLDRLGFFSAAAAHLTRRGGGLGGLWALAALVTTVLNLDASVVLLTPLYVRIARRSGRDPLILALMPVLLACLASSALPVSNLTNLIAVSATGASTASFVAHLGLPSLVAVTVGWLCYRRMPCPLAGATRQPPAGAGGDPAGLVPGGLPGDDLVEDGAGRALAVGGIVVVVVLAGFTAGRQVGLQPWMVALAGDVVLLGVVRKPVWRAIPAGTALVAASLGLLAAAAVSHLPIDHLLGGTSTAALARTAGVTAAAANVVNNLPALLVVLPALGSRPGPQLWAVLIGVNMGPVLLVTGSLASLLWLDALGRLGVKARPRDFTRAGVQVGLPAALAGLGTHLLLHAGGFIS